MISCVDFTVFGKAGWNVFLLLTDVGFIVVFCGQEKG
jgi:hypothetical protein